MPDALSHAQSVTEGIRYALGGWISFCMILHEGGLAPWAGR